MYVSKKKQGNRSKENKKIKCVRKEKKDNKNNDNKDNKDIKDKIINLLRKSKLDFRLYIETPTQLELLTSKYTPTVSFMGQFDGEKSFFFSKLKKDKLTNENMIFKNKCVFYGKTISNSYSLNVQYIHRAYLAYKASICRISNFIRPSRTRNMSILCNFSDLSVFKTLNSHLLNFSITIYLIRHLDEYNTEDLREIFNYENFDKYLEKPSNYNALDYPNLDDISPSIDFFKTDRKIDSSFNNAISGFQYQVNILNGYPKNFNFV